MNFAVPVNEKFEKEIPMASMLTLNGIDQAISNLNYSNKNSIKYRFVHLIRQYYTNESSVELVDAIDTDELIKVLWDTGDNLEAIKYKRKNLNSVRSSANADLKKLYEKGENPEGIIIGPDNIFSMSEDAKDKMLNEYGFGLKPDGTRTLSQIMDILRLANEIVSGSMDVEDTESKNGLSKIDQLKDLISGLSKKMGLAGPELSETDTETEGKKTDSGGSLDESEEVEDADDLEEDEVLEEIEDLDEEEVIDELEEDKVLEEVDDLEEDEVLEEVEDIETDDVVEENDLDDDIEDIEVSEEEKDLEGVEAIDIDELAEGPEDSETAGGQGALQGEGIGQGLDKSGAGDDTDGVDASEKDAGIGIQSGDTGDGDVAVGDEVGADGGSGPGSLEGGEAPEGMEIDESEEVEDADDLDEDLEEVEDVETDEIIEEDEVEDDIEEVDDFDEVEELEELEDIETDDIVEEAGIDGGLEGVDEDLGGGKGRGGFEEAGWSEKPEGIGLPVDSLGAEYPDEVSDKINKNKLLAEEFDGYLGTMDRYYNHYILIPGGEYIDGSKQPGKDEKSEHLVSLSPFYIGRFPVTNGLFEIFVEKAGYKTVAEKVGYGNVYYGRCQRKKDEKTGLITSTWNSSLYCETVEGACWYQPSGPGSTLHNKRNHPVVQINLEDAMAFAAWTGKRLPTEDEWEAASRTEKGWIFPWGNEWKQDSCNIEDSCASDTTPVEKYAEFENDFGIVDTMGNILEWTSDNFSALSDNKNISGYYIAKGGSWISGDDIRLFSRFKIAPEPHSNILGFRCVAH